MLESLHIACFPSCSEAHRRLYISSFHWVDMMQNPQRDSVFPCTPNLTPLISRLYPYVSPFLIVLIEATPHPAFSPPFQVFQPTAFSSAGTKSKSDPPCPEKSFSVLFATCGLVLIPATIVHHLRANGIGLVQVTQFLKRGGERKNGPKGG